MTTSGVKASTDRFSGFNQTNRLLKQLRAASGRRVHHYMVPPTGIDSMNVLEFLLSEPSSDWPPHRYSLGFPGCYAGYRRQFATCLLTRFRKATSAFTLPESDLRASGWRVLTQRPPALSLWPELPRLAWPGSVEPARPT